VKTAIIVTLFVIALFVLWRLNSAKKPPFAFNAGILHIHGTGCAVDLPSSGSQEELVDVLDLSRYFLKLPNGETVIYETIDFPTTYDFAFPADAIVAKIFRFKKFRIEEPKKRGILFIEGVDEKGRAFTVLAVLSAVHRLELLYPLGKKSAGYIEKCLIEGKKEKFPKEPERLDTAIRPNWSESEIIKENMIEKDM